MVVIVIMHSSPTFSHSLPQPPTGDMLSYELFSSILEVMKDHYLPNGEEEEILKILENCSTLNRMDTVLLFMDDDGFLLFKYFP